MKYVRVQNKPISGNKTLRLGSALMDLSVPKVMGIINVTPDSFFSGSRSLDLKLACENAERMIGAGASIIDVGGYSTRPGAEDISVETEIERTIPVIREIQHRFQIPVSIDTFRYEVARQALDLGALMINDVTGGVNDERLFKLSGEYHVPYVLMHSRGTPETMQSLTHYENLLNDVILHLKKQIDRAHENGAYDLIIDPGFGFAKNPDQNFSLLNNLEYFKMLGKPVLAGLSRKSMIWKTLGSQPEQALNGTTALNMVALLKGASILRVHDVQEATECVKLFCKLVTSK